MGNKIKILFIDDSNIIRTSMKDFLFSNGYDIILASDGKEGLKLYFESKPDLIISDINMPNMDGFELLSNLKNEIKELPFIIMSSIDDMKNVIKAMRLGAWDYIQKNITDMDIILYTIDNALKKVSIIKENREHREHLEKLVKDRTYEVEKLFREKETLYREVHHRVKNNLQIIISLLSMQLKKYDDNSIKDFANKFIDRINSFATIHENIYKSEDLSRVNLKKYIEELCLYLKSRYPKTKDIKFELLISDINIKIDKAQPFGLIVNEVISNALKHAFTNNLLDKKIKIILENKNEIIHFACIDNGKGIQDTIDIYNSDTLGFQLMMLLSNQLDGMIKKEVKNGTAIHLWFDR